MVVQALKNEELWQTTHSHKTIITCHDATERARLRPDLSRQLSESQSAPCPTSGSHAHDMGKLEVCW